MAQLGKNLPSMQKIWFDLWVRKIPWRREWIHTLVFLPGEFHGQRSLEGYSPWSRKESDMAERLSHFVRYEGLPLVAQMVKESTCQCRRLGFIPWVRKIPWRRAWQPTPVFLPGKSHGQRSLEGYSPWGCKESYMTEQLTLTTIGDTARKCWSQD